MAFQQGLSGLSIASKALDAISNNVSNTGTVGFKQASAQFADVFAASLDHNAIPPCGVRTRQSRRAISPPPATRSTLPSTARVSTG